MLFFPGTKPKYCNPSVQFKDGRELPHRNAMKKYGIVVVFAICSVVELSSVSKRNKRQFQAIFPGTKWCGGGNIADSYNDLGRFRDIDMCCRAHDSCPDGIPPMEEKYGIYNPGRVYISLCSCDDELYRCLKNVSTPLSKTVGSLFFNVLDTECLDQVYPQMCVRRGGIFGICLEYEEDTDAEKVWGLVENDRQF